MSPVTIRRLRGLSAKTYEKRKEERKKKKMTLFQPIRIYLLLTASYGSCQLDLLFFSTGAAYPSPWHNHRHWCRAFGSVPDETKTVRNTFDISSVSSTSRPLNRDAKSLGFVDVSSFPRPQWNRCACRGTSIFATPAWIVQYFILGPVSRVTCE